ncbi:unnamed protein product [Moneuplotes crassus]|uniref:Rab-GAP TBC domain-containing protein n=1 Tax=Euplotes crassus TaxID=5936 RepID=A0AAD1UT16_EUPCR|nr:unnamed protein product [Moneuplotes crassus]
MDNPKDSLNNALKDAKNMKGKEDKKKRIKDVLDHKPINIRELREHCISEFGLVDSSIRKKAWPILLNIHDKVKVKDLDDDNTTTPKFIIFDKDKSWNKHQNLEDEKTANQIDKDVNRSFKHFTSVGIKNKISQLSRMMNSIFQINQDWFYYQGFHDICSVPLMVFDENMAFHVSISISNYFIKDFFKFSFDKGINPALMLMMKIIQVTHKEVYEKISFLEIPPFAVSWIITWFSHNLNSSEDICRIFDYCTASHPTASIYLAAATMIHNKDKLEDLEEGDIASLHLIFQKLGTDNFDLEKIVALTEDLMKTYPPEDLLYENRKIGLENDSPILNPSLQLTTKIIQVAEETQEKYIIFPHDKSPKSGKYLSVGNLAAFLILIILYFIVQYYRSLTWLKAERNDSKAI